MTDRLRGLEGDPSHAAPLTGRARFLARAREKIGDPLRAKAGALMSKIKSASTGDRARFRSASYDLDLSYITDRVIAMAAPVSGVQSVLGNDVRALSRFFEEHHKGHYMIWNLNEASYDYSLFNDQVLEFFVPPQAPPPLEMLFQICDSIDSWLRADPLNVAAVHCGDGRGRTGVVVSCYLRHARFFETGKEAMQHFASKRSTRGLGVRTPSQRRYVLYFCDVLSGSRSSTNPVPVSLRRVVMNPVPRFGAGGTCRPYMQIFQDGKEVYNSGSGETKLRKYSQADGSILLELDVLMRGDITIALTHVGLRRHISMCRFSFHTAFVPSGVLRLTPRQLDGKRVTVRPRETSSPVRDVAGVNDGTEERDVDSIQGSQGSQQQQQQQQHDQQQHEQQQPQGGAPASPEKPSFASKVARLAGGGHFAHDFFMDLIFEHEGIGPAPGDATAWDVMKGRDASGTVVGSGAAFVNLADSEAENEWRNETNDPSAGGASTASPTMGGVPGSTANPAASDATASATAPRRGSLLDTDSDTSSLGALDDEALAGIELSSSEDESDIDSDGDGGNTPGGEGAKRNGSGVAAGEPRYGSPDHRDADPTLRAIDMHATPVGARHVTMALPESPAAAPQETRGFSHRRVASDITGMPSFDEQGAAGVMDLIGLDDEDSDADDADLVNTKEQDAEEAGKAGTTTTTAAVGDLVDLQIDDTPGTGTAIGNGQAPGPSVDDLLG